jgi:hypothetical protein
MHAYIALTTVVGNLCIGYTRDARKTLTLYRNCIKGPAPIPIYPEENTASWCGMDYG